MTRPDHIAGPAPGRSSDAGDGAPGAWLIAALALAAFGLCGGLRLLSGFRVLDGRSGADALAFLTTHDSYAWIAGAERVNQYSDSLLAVLLRLLHGATGLDVAVIAFWLPVALAPLVVVPACLLAAWWRMPEAAPAAAVCAGASYGFLSRTGVGACDTDVLALLFPVVMALCLIALLEPLMRPPRGRGGAPGRRAVYAAALGTGLLLRAYLYVYPSGLSVGLTMLGCAAAPALLLAKPRLRCDIASALAIVLASGAGSRYGLLAGIAAVLVPLCGPGLLAHAKVRLALAAVLAGTVLFTLDTAGMLHSFAFDLNRYGRVDLQAASVALPSTIKTVQEAQPIPLSDAVAHMAGNWALFGAGICGLVWLLWRRPAALVLAPLLLLGLSSTVLGSRFSMYGGPAVGAGLGFGLAVALKERGLGTAWRWIAQLPALAAALWCFSQQAMSQQYEAVLQRQYAGALQELAAAAAPGAQLWVWWDCGYAAQHYARRMTFADGSRNTGEYTIPLGLVYGSVSPRYAARLMAYTACRQLAAGELDRHGADAPLYPNPFLQLLHDMSPGGSQQLLRTIESAAAGECARMPEQYLVVSWDTVKLAKTISELATWDLASGSSRPGSIFPVAGNIDFNMKRGVITVDGQPHPARAAAIMTAKGTGRYNWPGNGASPFLVGNNDSRELFAMDGALFGSLMVQMLVAEPKRFEPYFTLVVDRLPYARVYRLNPEAEAASDALMKNLN